MYKIKILLNGYSLMTQWLNMQQVKNFIKIYYFDKKTSEIIIKNMIIQKDAIKGFEIHGLNEIETSGIDIEIFLKESKAEALIERQEDENNE